MKATIIAGTDRVKDANAMSIGKWLNAAQLEQATALLQGEVEVIGIRLQGKTLTFDIKKVKQSGQQGHLGYQVPLVSISNNGFVGGFSE